MKRLNSGLFALCLALWPCVAWAGAETYNEQEWFNWWDQDHDCELRPSEELRKRSIVKATVRNCKTVKGMWVDPYTMQLFFDPKKMALDHIVPIRWAFDHGAHHWPLRRKRRFTNDPDNILFVAPEIERQKGNKSISQWLPDTAFLCHYVYKFNVIVERYNLFYDPEDRFVLHWYCKGPPFPHTHVPMIKQRKEAPLMINIR